ncbi:hypothetical protein C0Q70_16495 [Pomacea canaliculata]|uniref:Lengsin n=1 Tax=Pomacea canaliculata TaxID=400727 RepID=A0A2T7NQ04_POMCA|nr:hypothetical protein C0Q70_16495 [Pomacea canaliculata]
MEELDKYSIVHFILPDINAVPRGKLVIGKAKYDTAKNGLEMFVVSHQFTPYQLSLHDDEPYSQNIVVNIADIANHFVAAPSGTPLTGPNCEFPLTLPHIGKALPNNEARPQLDTLVPLPWLQQDQRSTGSILCGFYTEDGSPNTSAPRQLLQVQVDKLRKEHDLLIKTAFEYEFYVFREGTLDPHCNEKVRPQGMDMYVVQENQGVLYELTNVLESMGVNVNSIMAEFSPGQWEFTTEPEEGVKGGDIGFYAKTATKGFFRSRGFDATFMTRPVLTRANSGLHLNHSLWKASEPGENAFLQRDAANKLSTTAKHWLAGLLAHAPALTAMCCPTPNCYRRMFNFCTPGLATWGLDSRIAVVRVRTRKDNVFVESRLPSGAANPYLALAATIAAGIDGLNRKLECPEEASASAVALPKSLSEALDALDKDVELRAVLGDFFVDSFIVSKRENELKPYDSAKLITEEEKIAFERQTYLKIL